MIIFAVDSAGKTAGAALLRDDTVLFEEMLHTGFTHSQTLLPLADKAFSACGLCAADTQLFCVTIGPGSFTGLRIGLALVKGMAFPFDTPSVGVSTLEALAAGYPGEGTLLCAQDARRGEVYWALFEKTAAGVRRLGPDAASPVKTALDSAKSAKKPLILLGDGAALCYNMLEDKTCALLAPSQHNRPALGAALAGRAAALRGEALSAAALQPQYLRLSQAERERANKLEKEKLI
ncbi:MAG: tRNA (adenosine(37)-N6)-threonylcarbamoyltransferase complex dimerization subunit type 1 TsaB [Oscillospiraceae bacterium]|nr:tRNA (adenosine(37)-N6)-threonylcarbamoyltransferase complex dimerization subunit type 1 TsaB [Oscillospiraceae bacterium]